MKPNKQASQDRKSKILLGQPKRDSKAQDNKKVHDTKGKNEHGRRFR